MRINFIRELLKNKDEVINSLLQQLPKRDNIVVQCNHSSTRETPDTIQSSVADIRKEQNNNHVRPNMTHAEIILDTSITENQTDIQNLHQKILTCQLHLEKNKHDPNRK